MSARYPPAPQLVLSTHTRSDKPYMLLQACFKLKQRLLRQPQALPQQLSLQCHVRCQRWKPRSDCQATLSPGRQHLSVYLECVQQALDTDRCKANKLYQAKKCCLYFYQSISTKLNPFFFVILGFIFQEKSPLCFAWPDTRYRANINTIDRRNRFPPVRRDAHACNILVTPRITLPVTHLYKCTAKGETSTERTYCEC